MSNLRFHFCEFLWRASLSAIARGKLFGALAASTAVITGCTPQIHSLSSALYKIQSGASQTTSVDHLVFVVEPSNATSQTSIGPSIEVELVTQAGSIDTSSNAVVTLAIGNNPSTGTLSGNLVTAAVAGVATFPGLSIDQAGSGYTLSANSGGLTAITSTTFDISAGSASKLVFLTQPSNSSSGMSLGSIAVKVEDAAGNLVTSSTAPIALAIANNAGPGGTLSGTLSVNAVSGIATLPGLSIDLDGIGYTLTATSGLLTSVTSTPFTISAGMANKLVFTTQPASAASGASLGSIVVKVEDADGNVVTGSSAPITLAIANNAGPGGVLSGTLTVNASSGVATLPGLNINTVGTGYTLTASASSLSSATSSPFNITAGAASQLVFANQPGNAASGASLGSVSVKIEDAAGNLVTTSTDAVTLAIATNAGPAGTLAGTTTVNAVSGVATIPGLSIDIAGTGYTLGASSGSLTGAISNTFNISAGTPTKLIITSEPTTTTSAVTINNSGGVVVKIEDAAGNVATSSSASVTFAVTSGPGTLAGTTTVSASSGIATFSNLSINQIATGYKITATASGLTSAVSTSFDITLGPGAQLVFTVQPANAIAGASIGGAPGFQISVEDAGGNLVTGSTAAITIAIGSGPGTLSGTLTENAVAGAATFTGNWIDLIGTHTLSASATSMTGTSASFVISPAAPTVLVFSGGSTVTMNGCATGYSLTTQDVYTNVSPVTSTTTFALASTGSTTFYNNASTCSGATTTASFTAGMSSFPISIMDAAREDFSVTASLSGWSPQSLSIESQTYIAVPTPTTVQAGVCTAFLAINEDANNSPVNVASDVTINFNQYVGYSGRYYSDSGCTTAIGSFVIPAGSHSATYYYQNNLVETEQTILNGGPFLANASFISLAITAGSQARTAIEGPSITTPGVCSSTFKVTALDSVYNQVTVAAPTTVTLSTSGSTLFYSDASCSTLLPSNQLTIATGSDSSLFYAKTAAAETATLTSTVSGNVSNGSFQLQTNSNPHTLVVATASNSACAVLDGVVKCWGNNADGELGNGTTTDSLTPVTASGLTGVTQIAASGRGYCALNSSGVWCWGFSGNGEVGIGQNFTNFTTPQLTSLTSGITQLVGTPGSVSGNDGFCAIQTGTVYCWGINGANRPTAISLPRPAIAVSAQGYNPHTCAVLNDGTVYCWGSNYAGQLGDGTTIDRSTPVQVVGVSGATSVATMESASCAIASGAVYCWGDQFTLTAENINFSGTAGQIVGIATSLSILDSDDGSVWYTGYISAPWIGYSGDGTGNSYVPPTFGKALTHGVASSIATFAQGACVVESSAGGQPSLECWGVNNAETYSLVSDGSLGTSDAPFWTFSLN